jgi:N-acetylglutamate synthase-like GNAT family acetyltransferase
LGQQAAQYVEQAMTVTLRPATKSDAAYLLKLEEVCMRAYAEALWGGWKQSDTVESLDVAGHEVIEQDGNAVGCIAAIWHADHLFIEKLYIGPAFQGRGIGTHVLNTKSCQAAQRGLPMKLSVLTTNPADRFYQREGFVLEAETQERRLFSKAAPTS